MADANPNLVGGPGQTAAVVAYPSQKPKVDGKPYYYNYNYKDSVDVQWFSYAENATETTMQIWYWSPTFPNNSYKPFTKYVVPQNGTLNFDLSDGITDDLKAGGFYLGQWNLNFTRTDRQPITGLTLAQPFNCTFDDSKAATTYAPSATPSSTDSSSRTSTAASSVSSATSPPTSVAAPAATTTAPSTGILGADASSASSTVTPVSNGISGGAIAGIVIGVLLAVALGAAGAFFFLRRKRQQDAANTPPGFPPAPYPGAGAYKQQPMMAQHSPGVVAAGHYAPPPKSLYTAQEQYMPPGYVQHQQYPPQQQAAYVSELPVGYHQGQAAQPLPQQYSQAQTIRQELPAERYS